MGRTAGRIYLVAAVLLLVASAAIRLQSFILTRRIAAVVSALSKVRIDQTTEADLLRVVPYLVRGQSDRQVERSVEVGDVDEGLERFYYVTFSNKASWMRFETFAWRCSSVEYLKDGHPKSWVFTAASLLGYRYVGFGARVVLFNGRVSSISYGIADDLVFPQQLGNIVSVRSVHGRWAPHQSGFEVSSTEDQNPQFSVSGSDRHLWLSFTFDAPPELKSHAFRVELSCFWSFSACDHSRQVAPLLSQDENAIEAATLARLKSNDPCPDPILSGRVRYIPDIDVVLLESTGFKGESVNEDGLGDPIGAHYRLIDVVRGRPSKFWESVRASATVPYPGDYGRRLPNTGLQWAKPGQRVLAFSNPNFDSCRLVLATPAALSAVRSAVPAPRRAEDEAILGIQ